MRRLRPEPAQGAGRLPASASSAGLAALLVLSLFLPVAGEAATRRTATKRTSSAKARTTTKKTTAKKRRGKRRSPALSRQTQPDPERSREIQEALRREGYLTAASSGKWDQATRDAMARYQKDQGVLVTGKPDALSLIKMGLGPSTPNR